MKRTMRKSGLQKVLLPSRASAFLGVVFSGWFFLLLPTGVQAESEPILRAELVIPSFRSPQEGAGEPEPVASGPGPGGAAGTTGGSAVPGDEPEEEEKAPWMDREAPGDMVIDDLGLLEVDSKMRLAGVLSGLRESRGVYLYAVVSKATGSVDKDELARISARWSGEVALHGIVLLTSDMTLPIVRLGGDVSESEAGTYVAKALAEAMLRGRSYRTRADVFRACTQEVAEELEILMNRYAYRRENARDGGDDWALSPESETLAENQGLGLGAGVRPGGGPAGIGERIASVGKKVMGPVRGKRSVLRWVLVLLGGAVVLVLLVFFVRAFLRRKLRLRQGSGDGRKGRLAVRGDEQAVPASLYASLEQQEEEQGRPSFSGGAFPVSGSGSEGAPPAPSSFSSLPRSASAPASDPGKNETGSFPEVEVDYRYRSPYGGGNDIVVNLLVAAGEAAGAGHGGIREENGRASAAGAHSVGAPPTRKRRGGEDDAFTY